MLTFSDKQNISFFINSKDFDNIEFRKIDQDSVIVLCFKSLKYFIKVPKNISFFITEFKQVCFFTHKNVESLLPFLVFKKFLTSFNSNKHFYKKKLELNGLGYKFLNTDGDTITMKLGYSHLVSLPRPSVITRIAVKKKKVLIEGIDKIKLSNFANTVYQSRKYDIYKGKGFFFSNVKRKLKEIKKK